MRKAHIARHDEAIRTSLVELRRLFQRKELVERWAAVAGGDPRLGYGELRLLDAVRVAQARGEVTVGDLAELLGLDPSRASREVARAVANKLLLRRVDQRDGRKVVLAITPRGARLQAKGSELTRARIGVAIAGWTETERARFAQLFARFVTAIVT
jgi:DNA-binding MarR family transcriptional regulator